MVISTFLITALGAFVTLSIVEPKLGTYDESMASEDLSDEVSMEPLSSREIHALKMTGLAVLLMIGVLVLTILPENGRSEEHTSELQSRGHLVCRLLIDNRS